MESLPKFMFCRDLKEISKKKQKKIQQSCIRVAILDEE